MLDHGTRGGDVGCSLGGADRSGRLIPLASGHTRSRPLPPKEIHSATVSEYPGPPPLPAIPSIPHEECGGFFSWCLGALMQRSTSGKEGPTYFQPCWFGCQFEASTGRSRAISVPMEALESGVKGPKTRAGGLFPCHPGLAGRESGLACLARGLALADRAVSD
jgi:hypothetical protein